MAQSRDAPIADAIPWLRKDGRPMTRTKTVVAIMAAVVLSALAFTGVAGAKDKGGEGSSFTLASVNPEFSAYEWGSTSIDTFYTTEGTLIDGAWAGGRCVSLVDGTYQLCDMVVRLPEGDITLTGLVEAQSSEPWVFVVTGGTGQFHSARGEVETAVATYDPFVVHFTFWLKGASADY
jgi:hypothetical protein